MASKRRAAPVGVPQHVIQRGNCRQVCFGAEDDMRAYLHWLKEYAGKCKVDVHARVLMSNHVHLLCTPRAPGAVSGMRQATGRMCGRYFNCAYQRTGTLWEGRYKPCPVESEPCLLHLQRYIELNPLRAGRVMRPGEYTWSSDPCSGLGKQSERHTPRERYLAVKFSQEKQLENHRGLFAAHGDGPWLDAIRKSVNKKPALGSEHFAKQIEQLTG